MQWAFDGSKQSKKLTEKGLHCGKAIYTQGYFFRPLYRAGLQKQEAPDRELPIGGRGKIFIKG